jgi:putative toxin-antitoxin system antitoxin component (TIGR02293 family)
LDAATLLAVWFQLQKSATIRWISTSPAPSTPSNVLPLLHVVHAILADGEYTRTMAVGSKRAATFVPAAVPKSEPRIGKTLGLKSMDVRSLMHKVDSGLSWASVRRFLDAARLTQQEMSAYLNLPERTFARRREAGAFDRTESEQILRLSEIWEAALDLFEADAARTHSWLTTPAFGLGNVRPIDLAKSEFGAREVRSLIGRLADGVFS